MPDNPFKEGRKESYDRKQKNKLEACFHVRDLISHSKETKELWEYFCTVLAVKESLVLQEMGEGKKYLPVFDNAGSIVNNVAKPFDIGDYRYCSGMVEGLQWLEDEVKSMITRANNEEIRKAEEEEKE